MQASMLIPIGVILYTAAGGLKATFMASYVHTGIVMIALLIFTFQIYASGQENIGSPSAVRPLHPLSPTLLWKRRDHCAS